MGPARTDVECGLSQSVSHPLANPPKQTTFADLTTIFLNQFSYRSNDVAQVAIGHLRVNRQRYDALEDSACAREMRSRVAERIAIIRMQVQGNEVNRSANPAFFQSFNELIASDL